MGSMGFWHELKRRHVYRVAVAYAIVGWLLIQIVTQVFPIFHLPDWIDQAVVLLILVGFPIALVLAWAFDAAPEGIVRTAAPDEGSAVGAPTGRRSRRSGISVGLVGVLIALIAGGAYWHFGRGRTHVPEREHAEIAGSAAPSSTVHDTAAATHASAPSASSPIRATPIAAQPIPAKSIAVLPFENLSTDKGNAYFADGMQDLILTKLADIGDLKVIARTSTLSYGSHPENLTTVGEQLRVATLLEGSVQKSGNQVLINVQLIDAKTDAHIWAQSYQRTLDNVFGVEGDVAEQIATALKAKLSPTETRRLATALSSDPAANNVFLRAEYFANQGDISYATASWKQAIPLYRQAIAEDPNFALAKARLSYTESVLAWFGGGGEDVNQLNADARAQALQSLALAPDLPAAHLAIGYSDYYGKANYPAALKAFGATLKLRPNDASALAARGYVLRRQGRFDAALDSLTQAIAHDPRNSYLAFVLGDIYSDVGRYADSQTWYQRALALDPNNLNARIFSSQDILYAGGDIPQALRVVQGDAPALKLQRVSLLTYARKYQQALTLLDSVPDTPDNFSDTQPKVLQQADLCRLMGEHSRAQPLFQQALSRTRAQLATFAGTKVNESFVWNAIADTELGLGHTSEGLAAIGKSQALVGRSGDHVYGPEVMESNAALYAEAGRADLALPLLAKALASPGIGRHYSAALLWLDPAWDPIRKEPRFQALLKKYAEYRPVEPGAVIPAAGAAVPASAATSRAGHG